MAFKYEEFFKSYDILNESSISMKNIMDKLQRSGLFNSYNLDSMENEDQLRKFVAELSELVLKGLNEKFKDINPNYIRQKLASVLNKSIFSDNVDNTTSSNPNKIFTGNFEAYSAAKSKTEQQHVLSAYAGEIVKETSYNKKSSTNSSKNEENKENTTPKEQELQDANKTDSKTVFCNAIVDSINRNTELSSKLQAAFDNMKSYYYTVAPMINRVTGKIGFYSEDSEDQKINVEDFVNMINNQSKNRTATTASTSTTAGQSQTQPQTVNQGGNK